MSGNAWIFYLWSGCHLMHLTEDGAVPRYHFIVQDGSRALPSHEEMELSDLEEARNEAIRRFDSSSHQQPEQLRSGSGRVVEVTDASGGVLFSLHVFAAESACFWPYHLSRYPQLALDLSTGNAPCGHL